MKIALAGLALLAGCTATGSPSAVDPRAQAHVGLANPAAMACVQAGGRSEIVREARGERGLCLLPGGLRCDEWAWFRKEAGACCSTGTAQAARCPTP